MKVEVEVWREKVECEITLSTFFPLPFHPLPSPYLFLPRFTNQRWPPSLRLATSPRAPRVRESGNALA